MTAVSITRRIGRWIVGTVLLVALWGLAVGVASWIDWSAATRDAQRASPSSDWGSEALTVARQQALDWMPLPVANACGIGASSCFKCHNGTRAAAPKSDKANRWHADHKTVNDSCVGCHGGNARLIKKEIAHANLVKDARTKPEMCSSCHKSGDLAALVKTYAGGQ
jgi:hypothetical protein